MNSEEQAIYDWIQAILSDPEWLEVENRPWGNDLSRYTISGCSGKDYVMYDPRITMRFFWNEKEQQLAGTVQWDERSEGPPGVSHGASIMTVFDEILAYPVWRLGIPAFTANVNINLRKPVPFCASALFSARITGTEGRKRFTVGKITDSRGVVYAEATGIWVTSTGIGRSMAVHDAVLHADNLRQQHGQRELVARFVPPVGLPGAPLDLPVRITADAPTSLADQFFPATPRCLRAKL